MMDTMIDLAIVPVAGQGTRLLPSTKSQPKEMLPVGRKPAVQYVVEELAQSGMKRMLFITGPGKTSIENHFDVNPELVIYLRETGREELLEELEFERTVPEYYYTRQRRQLGLGHAVLCAESLVGDQPFVVALGDTILGLNEPSHIVSAMKKEFVRLHADALVALVAVSSDEAGNYGMVQFSDQAEETLPKSHRQSLGQEPIRLTDVIEKPAVGEAPSRYSIAARYVFSPIVFQYLKNLNPGRSGEIELTDGLREMIQDDKKVYGMCLEPGKQRRDIGNVESYFRAFMELALTDEKYGKNMRKQMAEFLRDHGSDPDGRIVSN